MHCAHVGILLMGVNKPLIKIKISIQNHMTNMAWFMVPEWLEMIYHNPETTRMKTSVAR